MPHFQDHRERRLRLAPLTVRIRWCLANFLRDVAASNEDQRNFRVAGLDETVSNLLGAVFEVTNRQWDARTVENDEFLAPDGRVLD